MNYDGKSLYKNMIGGSVSGVLSLTATYPTEYVKTLKQMGDVGSFYGIMRRSYKGGGLGVLYRGYLPVLCSIIPRAGLNYSMYEYSYYRYRQLGLGGLASNIMAGMTSGGLAGLMMATPVENMKIGRISGLGWRDLWEREGMRGFYKGFGPTVLKESTTYGARFFIYTTVYGEVYGRTDSVIWGSLIGGSVAGFVSSYVNNPVDVIQTRRQMPKGHKLDMTLMGIVRNEGIRSLYSGVVIRSVRTIPAAVISFMSYEFVCKRMFGLGKC